VCGTPGEANRIRIVLIEYIVGAAIVLMLLPTGALA
jgi:hypothetical protein